MRICRTIVVAVGMAIVVGGVASAADHPAAFWRDVVKNDFNPPPGTSARELAPELVAMLGAADPEARDDLAATILTSWIYRKKLLDAGDLRQMMPTLSSNLREGIGATESDTVLRRSFSALILSVIAARDNEASFLTAEETNALLDAALAYFRDEQDVRGFDDRKGWIHSAAHTADLLKFLARSRKIARTAQRRVLDAITDKIRQVPVTFTYGEDERVARIPISIVRRVDFDREAFQSWVGDMADIAAFPRQPSVASLRVMTNARHVLAALWTELSIDVRPSRGADVAREALRERLSKLY